MVASAAAVVLVVALAIGAFAGSGRGAGAAFNACIGQTRFLVLVRHPSGNKVVEMIKDRARSAAVGEFAHRPVRSATFESKPDAETDENYAGHAIDPALPGPVNERALGA
jgi:hypothetical protein